jgi:hypothetical protein
VRVFKHSNPLEYKLGNTPYVGPEQKAWEHPWNGVKGAFLGGTQAERVGFLETQAEINKTDALETLKLFKKEFIKDHPDAPEGAWDDWKAKNLTTKIQEALKAIEITPKPDAPKTNKDDVEF